MKLYHSPTSPYVRKVMVTLHLTGQLGDVELTPGSGTPLEANADTITANPLGKVPCLIDDQGLQLGACRIFRHHPAPPRQAVLQLDQPLVKTRR